MASRDSPAPSQPAVALTNPLAVTFLALAGLACGLTVMVPGAQAGDFYRTSGAVWLVLICALLAACFLAAPVAFTTYRALEADVEGGGAQAVLLAVAFFGLVVAPWLDWSQGFVPANPVVGIEWRFWIVVLVAAAVAFVAVLGIWRVHRAAVTVSDAARLARLRESCRHFAWILGALIGLATLTQGAYLVAVDHPLLRENLVKIAGKVADARVAARTNKPVEELPALSERIKLLSAPWAEPYPFGNDDEVRRVCGRARADLQEQRLERAAACVRAATAGDPAALVLARAAADLDSVLRTLSIRPMVILAVGAYYTLLLGLSFVPAHLVLLHGGERLRDRAYPPLTVGDEGFEARLKERATANQALGLDAGPGVALRQNVALFAPLAGGIVSALLTGRL